MNQRRLAIWLSRLAVGAVFVLNVSCAALFILRPEDYAGSFELSGAAGEALVRGFGVLFLMWNVTYPLVILDPLTNRTLFILVLIQQLIGLVGEIAI